MNIYIYIYICIYVLSWGKVAGQLLLFPSLYQARPNGQQHGHAMPMVPTALTEPTAAKMICTVL